MESHIGCIEHHDARCEDADDGGHKEQLDLVENACEVEEAKHEEDHTHYDGDVVEHLQVFIVCVQLVS